MRLMVSLDSIIYNNSCDKLNNIVKLHIVTTHTSSVSFVCPISEMLH